MKYNNLEVAALSATPGPWGMYHRHVAVDIDNDGAVVIASPPERSGGKLQKQADANMKFISLANPDTILDLLSQRRAMINLLQENLADWEGEEDSVREEHQDLIERLSKFLDLCETT